MRDGAGSLRPARSWLPHIMGGWGRGRSPVRAPGPDGEALWRRGDAADDLNATGQPSFARPPAVPGRHPRPDETAHELEMESSCRYSPARSTVCCSGRVAVMEESGPGRYRPFRKGGRRMAAAVRCDRAGQGYGSTGHGRSHRKECETSSPKDSWPLNQSACQSWCCAIVSGGRSRC